MKQKTINILIAIWILILLVLISVVIRNATVGHVIITEQNIFTEAVNLTFTENSTHTIVLDKLYNLKSLRVSGSVIGNGSVKIYLEKDDETYLIYDSYEDYQGLLKVTGHAVEETNETEPINESVEEPVNETPEDEINETEPIVPEEPVNETVPETINETIPEANKSIEINLEYKSDTNWDVNNDGTESIDGVVDFTVESTLFNWDVDEDKLCTKWSINSIDNGETTVICYGNQECCNFIGLEPTLDSWKEPLELYYGAYDSTLYNEIAAQVVYYDYNETTLESEIYYSEEPALDALFTVKYYFNDKCVETCALNLDASFFNLIIELDNAILNLDNVTYTVMEKEEIENQPPQLVQDIEDISINRNSEISIDLNDYFTDPNDDILKYDYYKPENISIIIEDDIATLIPDTNFTGTRYTYFIANDSEFVAVSNVFNISVTEEIVNNPPVLISNIQDITIRKNTNTTINLSDYFYDIDGDELLYSPSDVDDINFEINKDIIKIIPNHDFIGNRTVIFTASDNIDSVNSNKIAINISENVTNNPPILLSNISDIKLEANNNYTINLNNYFLDPDNDALLYSVTETDNISFITEDNLLKIVPDKDFTGVRFFYVTANDSEYTAESNLIKINISQPNNPPYLINIIYDINIHENSSYTINLSNYFADPDLDALTYDYYKTDNIEITIENSIATLTPDANFIGVRYTYITSSDFEYSATSNVFSINVTPYYYDIEEKYIPVTALYYENSCYGELCPEFKYQINPELFCTLVNDKVYNRDFEAELTFNITGLDSKFNSALVCAYEHTSFHNLPVTNYIEPINYSIPSAAPNLTKIDETWHSALFTKAQQWQCIDITSIVKNKIEQEKQFLYLRWWGQDMNSTNEPYACFLGINSSLEDCGNNSNTTDCRPYLHIR